MNQLFYNIAGGIVHQIRREKRKNNIAHAISVHYWDFEHAYVYWIWLRGSASYVIINISDDSAWEIWWNGVEILITRVAYSFRVVAAARISCSPLHNSQEEKKKHGIHLQEEKDFEYVSTKDIIMFPTY